MTATVNGTAVVAAPTDATVAPPLSVASITQRVVRAEYAVRGEIVRRASVIEEELNAGRGSYPFSKVVWCNIGNPQILGQQPMTYFRQVLSLCEYPQVSVTCPSGGLAHIAQPDRCLKAQLTPSLNTEPASLSHTEQAAPTMQQQLAMQHTRNMQAARRLPARTLVSIAVVSA